MYEKNAESDTFAFDDLGKRMFPALFVRLDDINDARETLTVSAGSEMDADHHATAPFAVGNKVEQLLTVGTDHLGMMRTFIESVHLAPPFALFTLMRASIESSCVGLWLLLHGKRKDRIERFLKLTWSEHTEVAELVKMQGVRSVSGADNFAEHIERIVRRHKNLQQFDVTVKSITSTTNMIIYAQARLKSTPSMPALEAWRICSGMTHSNLPTSMALLGSRQIGADNVWGARHEVKASIFMLATIFETGVFYTEALLDAHRNKSSGRRG